MEIQTCAIAHISSGIMFALRPLVQYGVAGVARSIRRFRSAIPKGRHLQDLPFTASINKGIQ